MKIIRYISINPSEISNIYLLDLDHVTEFYDASPSFFVPGFGFTFKAFLDNVSRKRLSQNFVACYQELTNSSFSRC
jgi:hypothetical protein